MRRRRQDPRSGRRAGREVRRRLRAEKWALVRQHRGRLGVGLAVYLGLVAALTVVFRLLDQNPFSSGFFAGFAVGALPFLATQFFLAQGLGHRSMGAEAEARTAEELDKLSGRRWAVFHHVPLARGDIDHVVIGPGRVYAVETKWTARRDLGRFLKGAGGQAAWQAARLEKLLAERGVRREVVPLLVVWGPGMRAALDKPRMAGRARAVAGANAADWLARMNAAIDRLEIDWPAQQAVEAHVRDIEAAPVLS